MNKGENKITQFQLFFIIIQTQIGIRIISLPYDVFQFSKNDAWISVLVAGGLAQIGILLIWLLYRRFPVLTIFEMMSEIIGKKLAFLLKICYISFLFSTALLTLLQFGQKVNTWILPRTPTWILLFLMIAVSVLCVKENLRVIARFFVVVSFLLIFLFAFTLVVFKDLNYLYLLPIGDSGLPNVLKGTNQALFALQGYELLLVVLPYCLGTGAGKLKIALMANGFVTSVYMYLTIVMLAYFGPAAMRLIPDPILYIMKFKYLMIIDRVDLIFFSIWIVFVTTSFMMYLYLTSNGLSQLFRKKNHSPFVYFAAALMLVFALTLPADEKVVHSFGKFMGLTSYLFIFGLPFILLMVSIVRGKHRSPGDVRS
jgi:spore germination protein (amino acid permease)